MHYSDNSIIGSFCSKPIMYLCKSKFFIMQKTLKIDENLYQKFVNFYTDSYHLPPLAAKIYAYLTFDFDNVGVTFDELVEVFKASKSSVSSNLQLLQTSKFIISMNKIDERKRFFIINPDYVKIRFNNLIAKLEKEKDILEHLKNFRVENHKDEKSKIYISKLDNYLLLLNTNIENFSKTLNNMYD